MKIILLETHYIPCVAYFAAFHSADELQLEMHENFQKQTYRNRCYINSSQGPIPLIVPLVKAGSKSLITEVAIDYSQRWQHNHWRAIQSSYGKAPFFEYYCDDLHDVLFKKFDGLFDLNFALLTLCLRWLKIKIVVRGTSHYEKSPLQPIYDLRSTISPKNAEVVRGTFEPAIYHQVFGSKFVENLSLIDLIFCEGPGALGIIHASSPKWTFVYWLNEHVSINLNGTNLTEQDQRVYSQYTDQLQNLNVQERRISAGVTFTL